MFKNKYFTIAATTFIISFAIFFVFTSAIRLCSTEKNKTVAIGDTINSEGKVMEFEYDKHKFINIVKSSENGCAESFVVHDPNCRCTAKKLNNITTVITNTDSRNSHVSDSITKTNFRVVLSKLNQLSAEVKLLRSEVARMKKTTSKPVQKKTVANKKTKK